MRFSYLACTALTLVVAGCGDEPPAAGKAGSAKAAPPAPQTERERQINNTQAASAVGYDGDALKESVQKTVNILEQHTAETQKTTDSAAQAEPDANK